MLKFSLSTPPTPTPSIPKDLGILICENSVPEYFFVKGHQGWKILWLLKTTWVLSNPVWGLKIEALGEPEKRRQLANLGHFWNSLTTFFNTLHWRHPVPEDFACWCPGNLKCSNISKDNCLAFTLFQIYWFITPKLRLRQCSLKLFQEPKWFSAGITFKEALSLLMLCAPT